MNTLQTKDTQRPIDDTDMDVAHDGTLDIRPIPAATRAEVNKAPLPDVLTDEEREMVKRATRQPEVALPNSPATPLDPLLVEQRASETAATGTAFPGEVVAAFWNPVAHPQYMSYGHTESEYFSYYYQRRIAGFRLVSVHKYVKNGQVYVDHLWNNGTYLQLNGFTMTVAQFNETHIQCVAAGYHLEQVGSFVTPNGSIRLHAIWNKLSSSRNSTWIQGWALLDAASKRTDMFNQGWRVKNLTAWNLPNNGPVRYDVAWEQTTSRTEHVYLNMTGEQVVREYADGWHLGWKLSRLQTFRQGNEQRFSGLWNPNPNGQLVLWGGSREQIVAEYAQSWQQGWRMGGMHMVKF